MLLNWNFSSGTNKKKIYIKVPFESPVHITEKNFFGWNNEFNFSHVKLLAKKTCSIDLLILEATKFINKIFDYDQSQMHIYRP